MLGKCDRNISVGIAAVYGLLRPWIETWCGRRFQHSFTLALGSNQTLGQWETGLYSGEKRPVCDPDHLPPIPQPGAKVKEEYSCTSNLPLGFQGS